MDKQQTASVGGDGVGIWVLLTVKERKKNSLEHRGDYRGILQNLFSQKVCPMLFDKDNVNDFGVA